MVRIARGAEQIGPWLLQSLPTEVEIVSGGGSVFFGWINIEDTAGSLEEAYAEVRLIDRGFANFNEDSVVEFRFCPGTLRNEPGPDLVVFDARLTTNSYAVSVDYDEFTAEVPLEADVELQPVGEMRTFYFQAIPGFTLDASIMAAAVDLSDLGVPSGQWVLAVHLRMASISGDPSLGMGALASPPCAVACDGTCDGIVGTSDLLALLSQWGQPGRCAVGTDGVGPEDLLELLANWGPCPN